MAIPKERSGTDGVCVERNWSELPEDILNLFSKKLPDISDFIRFCAVCKSWQLSAPVTDTPPQLPWLLESRKDLENPIIRFYCLSSGKVHTITCPGSHRARLNGPGCRYLLASNSRSPKMCLLNPLTHYQIPVPSVNLRGAFPEYIGPDLIEGGDILVISGVAKLNTYFPPNMMAFWRPKADDCVYVVGVGDGCNAFYMGQYFRNDEQTGITNVIDVSTKKLAYQVAPPEGKNWNWIPGIQTFMVESGGKILRVFQHYEGEQPLFDIYCLYFGDGEGKPFWVKMTNIGHEMLFLEYHRGLSFSASNFVGFKGNCIYFLEGIKYLASTQYLCRYDIGDGTSEVLPCPFDSMETWFVPSLVKVSDIKSN